MSEEETPTNVATPTVTRRQNDAIKSEGNPLARLAKKPAAQSGKSQSSTKSAAEPPEAAPVETVKLNLENLSDCRLIRPHELQPMTTKMSTFE